MRVNILGAWIDALRMEEVVDQITGFIKSGRPHQIITLNPEILYLAQQKPEILDLINHASLVTADGTGIVWASQKAGKPAPERVTGIDLMMRLVSLSAQQGWRIFLLGGQPGVVQEAACNLQKQYPELVMAGTHHGYFGEAAENEVVEMIRISRPHLLFVGMGAPGQDWFIARNLELMQAPVALGVGGSFDVIAGRVARAPVWMRRMRLEWLGRLIQEPRRIKRIMILPKFVWLITRNYSTGH